MTVSKDPSQEDSAAKRLAPRIFRKLGPGLGVGDEMWNEFLESNYKNALFSFLDHSNQACTLLFHLEDGCLVASNKAGVKAHAGRCVFFVRPSSQPLSPENFDDIVVSGELAQGPQASALLPGLIFPLLTGHRGSSIAKSLQTAPNQPFSVPAAVDLVALERAVADKGFVLDRATIVQLDGAASSWEAAIEAAILASRSQFLDDENGSSKAVAEAESWAGRAEALASLRQQLHRMQPQLVLSALTASGSSAAQRVARAEAELEKAEAASRAVASALRSLRPTLEHLAGCDDLLSVADACTLNMHGLLLAWRHCAPFRSTTANVTAMVQAMAEDVVAVAQRCINGRELLQGTMGEAADKARGALRSMGHCKSCYADARAKTDPGCHWGGSGHAFDSLDAFMVRCQDIYGVATAAAAYAKLEGVDFGSPIGPRFTQAARQLHGEFVEAQEKLLAEECDPLNLGDRRFPAAVAAWRQIVSSLDSRLAALVSQVLQAVPNVENVFKVFDSLEGLADRPPVRRQIEAAQLEAVRNYIADARAVHETFEAQKYAPPLPGGSPPCAGTVAWVRSLQDRLCVPMARLKTLPPSVMGSDPGREMMRVYETTLTALRHYETAVMAEWCTATAGLSDSTMRQPVLAATEEALLRVNFDPKLTQLLQEVRSLMSLPSLACPVPRPAVDFYRRESSLLQHIAALGQLVAQVNTARTSLLKVEAPLVALALEAAEKDARRAQEVTWTSPDLDSFVITAVDSAGYLSKQVKALRYAAGAAHTEAEKWLKDLPLADSTVAGFKRATSPQQSLAEFCAWIGELVKQRKEAVAEGATRVADKLAAAANAVGVNPASAEWKAFRAYVAGIAWQGLQDAVVSCLHSLAALLASPAPPAQLLTVGIQLSSSLGLQWTPPLGEWKGLSVHDSPGSAAEAVGWAAAALAEFCCRGALDDAIAGAHEFRPTSPTMIVAAAVDALQQALAASLARCAATTTQLGHLQALWQPAPPVPASMGLIEAEVIKLRAMQSELKHLPATVACGWISVDWEPAKAGMAREAGKRVNTLTESLKSRVETALEEISGFMQDAEATIKTTAAAPSSSSSSQRRSSVVKPAVPFASRSSISVPRSGRSSFVEVPGQRRPSVAAAAASRRASVVVTNTEQLYGGMRCFKRVAQRVAGADAELGPLLEAAAVLQRCGAPLLEDTATQLSETPHAWRSLQRKTALAKEQLAPAITAEATEVQRCMAALAREAEVFRAYFQKIAPFGAGPAGLSTAAVAHAAAALDELAIGARSHSAAEQQHSNLTSLTARAASLRECAALLSDKPPSATDPGVDPAAILQRCQDEIDALRQLWEEAGVTMGAVSAWDAMPWPQVDAEALGEECRVKVKRLKSLPRTVHSFEAYRQLEAKVQGIATVLPLVKELSHPAMKERHWAALSHTLGASLPADPSSLTLGALLALRLDQCADACAEVVDNAKREAVVERSLADIEARWEGSRLEFAPRPDGVPLVVISETIMEALESDGLTLQNLSACKVVSGNAAFREQVATSQKRLAAVDAVLSVWTDMQRKWTSLEAIFCGSADIRAQLPEETAAFDQVNAECKELLRHAPSLPGVVAACSVPGRRERLEAMLRSLELRERALQEYLETKRQAFPRFYFVSQADLLDILAKGSSGIAVERHLPKLFDNLHRLKWKKDAEGKPTTVATGMYSGEGEYVAFDGECVCEGPAEVWLARVVEAMQAALRAEYKAAMPAYEELPRSQWVLDWSAQTVMVVSRTYFTQEVNDAFADLEGGNEDALKGVLERQKTQLGDLITLINGQLSKNDRKKLITLCTIDVHARDVVARLIEGRCDSADAFAWQSQMRYGRDPKTGDPLVQICDAVIPYQFEYIGNCGCLCITPLTDRCYITLTQAQRLILGGAPAGPAGTGKTETTKDLARALGIQCYVFNCSDQMDYKAMGQIYKGLAQTGAWGCFDEFNRIPVPVLSVCSTQYKSVLDALRARQKRFVFEGTEIALKHSAMAHITMNPGYIGRAELPESLKALFRPVSMAAPDLMLITEIMLMAEGFQAARTLSRKFIALYRLCEDLLSKAKHYDWKLRAIKTTLYVAGGMKRAAPELSEEKVLLRALRDFNLGKLTADDAGVFSGLLEDLFPGTSAEVPRAVDVSFESKVKEAALELGYQPDPSFLLKVSQLREIFEVRWSVFLLGPAGCGKTAVWRTLQRALQLSGQKTVVKVINPKSVTRGELYGFLHPQTREWKEGLLSATFRDMSTTAGTPHQWIVFDGDIDAEWIESLNTVMDDNKVLTLASNERIPLVPSMRLLLEINHLNHASPATVSRGGVIYLNADDVGWRVAADSWLDKHTSGELRTVLAPLFEKYVDGALEFVSKSCATVVPLPPVNQVEALCKLLEGMLPEETHAHHAAVDRRVEECKFVFACVWALGGCLQGDKLQDHRASFSKWWHGKFKATQAEPFPTQGTVFDYYFDAHTGAWTLWTALVPRFDFSAATAAAAAGAADGTPLDPAALFVPTVETVRLQYLLKLLLKNGHNAMLVGGAGTGKTAIIRDLMSSLDSETYLTHALPLNAFHDGPSMQLALEAPLERKTGSRYGPPGSKKLVFFVDDANMPSKDKYDTQSALELLRQGIDSKGWFDKAKAIPKEVSGVQYLVAMNPAAGSFTLSDRLQRHFATFAVPPPPTEDAVAMFSSLVQGHLEAPGFGEDLRRLGPFLVEAAVDLHKAIVAAFVASAVKFHYIFTLREVAAVIGGLLRMTPAAFSSDKADTLKAARLWAHECERVYADRLTSEADCATFAQLRAASARRHLVHQGLKLTDIEARPLLFTSFTGSSAGGGEGDGDAVAPYDEVPSQEELRRTLEARLQEHNEAHPAASMDLVLFPQAAEHVTRAARVLAVPGGHVAMIGVGGSGKQSLARLSAHVSGCEVFQVTVSATYGVAEFLADLATLFTRCGAKSERVAFILTDAHLVNDRFMVSINELLATGNVSGLIGAEEKEVLGSAVRAQVKAAGGQDTPEACWNYVIKKLRQNLHIVLCLSPAGERLRGLARRFPSLVGSVVYDWLRPWSRDALEAVAARSLAAEAALSGEGNAALRAALAAHMANAHGAVEGACRMYLEQYRRHNYSTPKSFLEMIGTFRNILAKAGAGLTASRERLERGTEKISEASAAVEDLRVALVAEKAIVGEKKAAAAALIESIGKERAIVDEAVEASKGDEAAAAALAAEVSSVQTECSSDLAAAEPIIAAAEAALNSLDKNSLGELRSFGNPAAEVVNVVAACMILTSTNGTVPRDLTWAAGKKWMGAQSLDGFLKLLVNFDKDNVSTACVERVERDFLSQPTFTAEAIRVKSLAAAGLCAWATNICKYHRIYKIVVPKRLALAEANRKLSEADRKLSGIRNRITELREKVVGLEAALIAATEEKVAAEAQAEKTATKAALADRVIGGLGSEFERWTESIVDIKKKECTLIGDALLSALFVSYAGAFNAQLRAHLVEECWVPEARTKKIPLAEHASPMTILATPASAAIWAKEGLPGDRLSRENAAIVGATQRWPLLIDPQLHGAKWVRTREGGRNVVVLQQGAAKFMDSVVRCVEEGTPLLIENLPEAIDPALEPLVARRTTRRGRSMVLILGGREVAMHPEFRLYLHTKLASPHYGPEVAAQTTLVNFAVTPEGLEEQLLAAVVSHEAAELQAQASALAAQLAEYTVTLQELEDGLLARLAAAQGDILEDKPLVDSLEATKAKAAEVAHNVAKAKQAGVRLSATTEAYRPVAARGSLLYFFMDSLAALDRVYWFSMANFAKVMGKGMDAAPSGLPEDAEEELQQQAVDANNPAALRLRVDALIASVTSTVYSYVSQAMFERHKPAAAAQLSLAILRSRDALPPAALDFLLRRPQVLGKENPAGEWLSASSWGAALALEGVEGFDGVGQDLGVSAKRWKEWIDGERPEEETLPGEWKRLGALQRLLAVRALRPDRLGAALSAFVATVMGPTFQASKPFELEKALGDASPSTPVFIFVSPGVDAAASVEAIARKRGLVAAGRYASLSLGQGQEAPAMAQLRHAKAHGGWVLLQNIHLTMDWTWQELDRAVDGLEDAHPDFQLFLSAEPPPSLERPLPPSLLQACVKLTNEPPQGLRANLARAWGMFDDSALDACARATEYRAVLFALCFFHAALQERKKYGVGNTPGARSGIGWNMSYPFSAGDLRCSAQLAVNYVDSGTRVPWEDLRYLVGEIMYGGHVVEGWDRRLLASYLTTLLSPALLETGTVCPGLRLPPTDLSHAGVAKWIEENVPKEGSIALGLHPNAERGMAQRGAEELCAALAALQPGASSGKGGSGVEERCKAAMEAVLEGLPHGISMEDVRAAAAAAADAEGGLSAAPGPYAMVVIQECERMNLVLAQVRASLAELALGLKGDLVMSEAMDALALALAADRVPASWAAAAFPSLRPLISWVKNLAARHAQLTAWAASPAALLPSVWLPGLFNPASFLTAVQQVAARKAGWALDGTALVTEVTRKTQSQVDAPPREGAYIHGLTLEGARWDERGGWLEESKPKAMTCALPVLHVRGVPADKAAPPADAYPCPVYTTEARFRQEVFTVQLRGGKQSADRWATAGVALLLDVV